MENDYNKTKFLELEQDDFQFFAETDYLLRSGKHIQNIDFQLSIYDFLCKYRKELTFYYNSLFKVKLNEKGEEPDNYFYLQFDDETNSILKQNSKKLNQEYHLFGILLLKIIRVDKYFSTNINVNELKEIIKNNPEYKKHIYRLFAQSSKPTDKGENTISNWIDKSLLEFEKICWIKFSNKNNRDFFIPLPSISRLMSFYEYQIMNIDKLFDSTKKLEFENEE